MARPGGRRALSRHRARAWARSAPGCACSMSTPIRMSTRHRAHERRQCAALYRRPFQHASPAVLKAMRRPANQEKTLERIRAWRAICPDLTIRSTFIVGFPGETEDDFRFLIDWLDEARLDRVGAFQYEPVKGAAANDLGLALVPDEIKASRHERFMQRAQAISAEETRRESRQAPRGHRRRRRRASGERPQQGRRPANRRRRPHLDPPPLARRRHRDGQI